MEQEEKPRILKLGFDGPPHERIPKGKNWLPATHDVALTRLAWLRFPGADDRQGTWWLPIDVFQVMSHLHIESRVPKTSRN